MTGKAQALGQLIRSAHYGGSVAGRVHVPIAGLVSPFRYDIVVRAQFFELVANHPDPDSPELVELASRSAYGVWWQVVAVPRFRPGLASDPDALQAAFARRVRGGVQLWRQYEEHGFDTRHPVLLRKTAPDARSSTGRAVAAQLQLADGCHRVALLVRSGRTELRPGEYRIGRRALRVVTDNSAALWRALDVPVTEQQAFAEALPTGATGVAAVSRSAKQPTLESPSS